MQVEHFAQLYEATDSGPHAPSENRREIEHAAPAATSNRHSYA